MQVQSFQVGPILGHVTQTQARIFGKTAITDIPQKYQSRNRACKPLLGKVRIKAQDAVEWHTYTFRLNQDFDWSGVIVIENLTAQTHYIYQTGFIEEEKTPDWQLDWTLTPPFHFDSAPHTDASLIQFYFGSCRYPYLINEQQKISAHFTDQCFEYMLEKHLASDKNTVDFQLLLGDQIYADPFNPAPFSSNYSFESYCESYQRSFSTPAFKRAMAHIPTYMMLDDHEVENEFPANTGSWYERIFQGLHGFELNKVINALRAYTIYQVSHSPIFNDLHPISKDTFAIKGHNGFSDPQHFWYTFERGVCRFFIMDVRTERNLKMKYMIDQIQQEALLEWLEKNPDAPKFIGTSVPFFPDSFKENDSTELDTDKWSGFTTQRNTILDFIFQKKIKNIFFLSGDVHASFYSVLYSHKQPRHCIYNLVCSPFFWPEYKIFNAFRWQEKQLITNQFLKDSDTYFCGKINDPDHFYNRSAYAKVAVDHQQVHFEVFNRARDQCVISASFELF